jgi:hypothetical protein
MFQAVMVSGAKLGIAVCSSAAAAAHNAAPEQSSPAATLIKVNLDIECSANARRKP